MELNIAGFVLFQFFFSWLDRQASELQLLFSYSSSFFQIDQENQTFQNFRATIIELKE